MQNATQPAFIIRDLDKDPHGPVVPAKAQGGQGLATPNPTPGNSPDLACSKTMTRSESDLSAWSHTRSTSSISLNSKAPPTFPFTNIFKWKRTTSSQSVSNGMQSPPADDMLSSDPDYFDHDHDLPRISTTNLDNLGHAIRAQKSDFNSNVEAQLQEERRLRHVAEDRLTEVEEEVTRLCTVLLPTDTGETGEAYFSTIVDSVRLAVDSYEQRTDGLERQLEEKSSRLSIERRERAAAEIECAGLRKQLEQLQAQLVEAQTASAAAIPQETELALRKENQELREQLEKLKTPQLEQNRDDTCESERTDESDAHDGNDAAEAGSLETASEGEAHETLLQRVKDTEAQRDALRQVSRGLRQRLTIETRKNADRMRALLAIDRNFASKQPMRPHSRQASGTSSSLSVASTTESRDHSRTFSASKAHEGWGLQVGGLARPKFERFVTALDGTTGTQMLSV